MVSLVSVHSFFFALVLGTVANTLVLIHHGPKSSAPPSLVTTVATIAMPLYGLTGIIARILHFPPEQWAQTTLAVGLSLAAIVLTSLRSPKRSRRP